jgi:tRNA threonylcarbamoyladenosine biosynthesis protein TsaB
MSYILGIDTSSVELSVGLAFDGGVMAGFSRYLKHSHAEQISQSVQFLLSTCGCTPSQVDHAVIAVGPGSFTGLRIGISFLKGFCFGRDVNVMPVSSLLSMAMAWHGCRKPIIAAFDARNGEVFWARFGRTGDALERKTDDALTNAEALKRVIDGESIVVTDTLGYAKSSVFDFLKGSPNAYAVQSHPLQRGAACAALGLKAISSPDIWTTCSEISPQYLMVTAMEKKLQCAPK